MTNIFLVVLLGFFALATLADRTEQGSLLGANNFHINGEADGVVTIHLGPFNGPPTLKCKSDKPTNVGVQCKPANAHPTPLPQNQGIVSLALAGYAGMEITSSNPDAKCEYELITVDLASLLTSGSQFTGILCDNSGFHTSTGVIGGDESSTGDMSSSAESSSAGEMSSSSAPVLGETGAESSSSTGGIEDSSSTAPASSSTGLVSSTGISSTGLGSGGVWESIPCTSVNGQLQAKLFKAGWYVFVSIEKILQAVLSTPCDIIAGLNRTIQWAEDFAVDCKTQFENRMTVVEKHNTTKGDANQRHKDCGDDMGKFYDVTLENIFAEVESTLNFKYTEDMLIQKGKCGTCGKNLRWAFFDEVDSKWKYPEQPSEVDVNKKECTQKTRKTNSNWAVMYSADALNGTLSSSGGFSGGDGGDRSAADGLTTSFQVVASLASLVLMALFYSS